MKIKKLVEEIAKDLCYLNRDNVSLYDSESLSNNLLALAKLEGKVELVEVLDCGSVGGFGKGFTGHKSLEGRIKYLVNKYDV